MKGNFFKIKFIKNSPILKAKTKHVFFSIYVQFRKLSRRQEMRDEATVRH